MKSAKPMDAARNARSSAKPSAENWTDKRKDEMKPPSKRLMFGATMVTIPLLTACQSVPAASSSAIEETAAAERKAVCEALMPEVMSRRDYDASPPAIQEWITDTVLVWSEVCDVA